MSHFIRIFLTVGLSSVAVLTILVSTDQYGSRARMDVFIAERMRLALGRDVEVEQYVEAGLPRNYQREMNKVPFDGLRPYSTTQRPVQKQYTTPWGEVMTYTAQDYASWS